MSDGMTEALRDEREGWTEWHGGDCPVLPATVVRYVKRDGHERQHVAGGLRWSHNGSASDIVTYKITKPAPAEALHGGKLSGDHYYRVAVSEPISPEVEPYTAECADIIEALGMTFNEGEAFKAIWRLAAARQGRGKPGNKAQYDADKIAHYGARVAVQTRRSTNG